MRLIVAIFIGEIIPFPKSLPIDNETSNFPLENEGPSSVVGRIVVSCWNPVIFIFVGSYSISSCTMDTAFVPGLIIMSKEAGELSPFCSGDVLEVLGLKESVVDAAARPLSSWRCCTL